MKAGTQAPLLLISTNEYDSPYPVFPLGIGHLASALEAAGIPVEIIDMNLDADTLEDQIRRLNPRCIGLSMRNIDDIRIENTAFFAPTLAGICRRIRDVTSVPLILGGSGYSLFPEKLLDACQADFGVWGEGESSLALLIASLDSDLDYTQIPGLVYRRDGTIIVNPRTPLDPPRILGATRSQRLADFYISHSSMLNIQTQRGCAFGCCYCTYPVIEGTRFRRREAGAVCDEFEAVAAAGSRYLFIVDSVFNTSIEHVTAICEEILRRGIQIQWGCFLRPRGCTHELLALMARAGLKHIEFGTDSLCDSVLEAYAKGFTFADVVHASDCARAAKVYFAHFLIMGGPGETEATMKEAFENSKRITRTVFFPFIGMRIYPGTPLFEIALRENVITAHTDLLPPRFYVTPCIPRQRIETLLSEFNRIAKNWIVGEPGSDLLKVQTGLRNLGVTGPLWEFLIR
jgi:radical SAM superfamily enzyme YgiQ (UPF0313 family)